MKISKIKLGDFSAENDQHLEEYFIEEIDSYKSAIDLRDNNYLIVGRTGSGKSAIITHLHKKHVHDSRFLSVLIKPSKSYLDAIVATDEFKTLRAAKGIENIIYKLIWNYAIMVEVLKAKYGPSGPKKDWKLLKGNDLKAYRFLNKIKHLVYEEKTLTDILLGVIQEISISIKDVISVTTNAGGAIPYSVAKDLIQETEKFHEKGFWDVVGGSKLYVMFDDLDNGWDPNDENQQALMKGLFSIMKDYAYRPRVKPLIALRSNIYEGLNHPQRERFESNVLRIRWTREKLEIMIMLRIYKYSNLSYGSEPSGFFEISDAFNPLLYMISRTLYRPRDLIAFCNYAIEEASIEGASLVSKRHVIRAEPKYSKMRTNALADEWKYLYPSLDLLIDIISQASDPSDHLDGMSPRRFREILIKVKEVIMIDPDNSSRINSLNWVISYFSDDNDPSPISEILYKLGLIGVCREAQEEPIYVFVSDEMPKVFRDSLIHLHPMFSKSVGEELLIEDNPWV